MAGGPRECQIVEVLCLEHSQRTLQNAFFVKIEATVTEKTLKLTPNPLSILTFPFTHCYSNV
jgi:hypothetical protein